MIKNYVNISKRDFLVKMFELTNLRQIEENTLTKKEIWFLVEIMLMPDKYKHIRLATAGRKYLEKVLKENGWNISPQNMSLLIKILLNKQYLYKDSDGIIYVNKHLMNFVETDQKKFSFTFNFELE